MITADTADMVDHGRIVCGKLHIILRRRRQDDDDDEMTTMAATTTTTMTMMTMTMMMMMTIVRPRWIRGGCPCGMDFRWRSDCSPGFILTHSTLA